MTRKSVLGRGLASLIPEAGTEPSPVPVSALREVAPSDIDANHLQPRTHFDDERLAELTDSIREQGVLQPLVVVERSGGRYELIAGERRLRAARAVGLATVPVIVRAATDREMLELALIENIQRDELSAIEMARAFAQLAEQFSYSHEQIAQRVGKDRSTVTNHLRLLELPDVVQRAVIDGEITMGHARTLLGLGTEAEILVALDRVISRDLSVRQTEALVKEAKMAPQPARPRPPAEPPVEWQEVTRRLERTYGTRVTLNRRRGDRGTVELEFGSLAELNRILDRMLA